MSKITGGQTGRPYIHEYDGLGKSCLHCGKMFYLRDKKFQSLSNFTKRKYCSVQCSDEAKLSFEANEFWQTILISDPDFCCDFPGTLDHKGYGRAYHGGKRWRAHRLAYLMAKGEIPDSLMVLHSCDNRKCCNPHHLRIGTAKENWQDAMDRNRMKRGVTIDFPANDLFSEPAIVLAERYGVSISTIYRRRNTT